jgi:hypothetical protein
MYSKMLRHFLTVALITVPTFTIGAQAAHAEDLIFTLYNNSSRVLTEFHVEPTTSKTWGEDILTSDIAPGESATVTIADGKTTCMYGIRGAFKDGSLVERESLNLCELGSYTYSDK